MVAHLVARRLCDCVGHLEARALHATEEGAVDGACTGGGRGKSVCVITIRAKPVYTPVRARAKSQTGRVASETPPSAYVHGILSVKKSRRGCMYQDCGRPWT